MSAWGKGAADVERLLADRDLQRVPAARVTAPASLARPRTLLTSAATLLAGDPDSAFVLAYDAARQAGVAVLAQQGLRSTAQGGHRAVEQALRAQFNPGFGDFNYLRRRRNELEYPAPGSTETSSAEEAQEAIDKAIDIVDQATQVLTHLDLF